MGLLKFVIGVLGILLVIGAFSNFFLIAIFGGLKSAIILLILGSGMIYFGFYFEGGEGVAWIILLVVIGIFYISSRLL